MHGRLEPSARGLLTGAGEQLYLSARSFHRVLGVSRTIADLEGDARMGTRHVAEALGYRPRRVDIEPARGIALVVMRAVTVRSGFGMRAPIKCREQSALLRCPSGGRCLSAWKWKQEWKP